MLDTRPVGMNWRYQSKIDIKPSAEVKKCLFGEPEHDNLQTDLNQQLGEMQKADRLRWNYDFKYDEPLPGGRYNWESVGGGSNDKAEVSEADTDSDTPTSPFSPTNSISSSRIHSLSAITSAVDSPRTQRSLAEYFPTKKRSSPSTVMDQSRPKRMRVPALRDHITRPMVSRSLCGTFNPIDKPDSRAEKAPL